MHIIYIIIITCDTQKGYISVGILKDYFLPLLKIQHFFGNRLTFDLDLLLERGSFFLLKIFYDFLKRLTFHNVSGTHHTQN